MTIDETIVAFVGKNSYIPRPPIAAAVCRVLTVSSFAYLAADSIGPLSAIGVSAIGGVITHVRYKMDSTLFAFSGRELPQRGVPAHFYSVRAHELLNNSTTYLGTSLLLCAAAQMFNSRESLPLAAGFLSASLASYCMRHVSDKYLTHS